MAVNCQNPVDVTNIQFKRQDKIRICDVRGDVQSNLNLLTCASTFGLIFVGNPHKPEIKVLQNQKLIASKEEDFKVPVRTVPITNVPRQIVTSSDETLLAVNYHIQNSTLIEIFDVISFLSQNIVSKYKIPVATEANAEVVQILWNPVICSIFSVILNNGTLSAFNLKENSFEFNTATKQEPAQCACWSPKGKQLVVGFPNGKLVQYKQDLSVARTINCPTNIFERPFDTVAVQWLSVYQFAVVYLERGAEVCPNLYIVNAPKIGNPTYISYGDICYSSSGPRACQIFLKHVQPWNILLMASANSIEVGVLGTTEGGEAPNWVQYIPPDEARIELPLNTDKQETHPIGFALDTSSTHQLTIGETLIPVMPMVHLLSTDGHFVSFNFLNLSESAPGICSPPQPLSDTSGANKFVVYDLQTSDAARPAPALQPLAQSPSSINLAPQINSSLPTETKSSPFGALAQQAKPPALNTSFGNPPTAFGGMKPSPFAILNHQPTAQTLSGLSLAPKFGELSENNTATTGSFGYGQQQPLSFGINTSEKSKGILGDKAFTQEIREPQTILKPAPQRLDETNIPPKPLYVAPQVPQQIKPPNQEKLKERKQSIEKDYLNMFEIEDILAEMIRTEMAAFQIELNNHIMKSRSIDIMMRNMDDTKSFVKQLNGLQDLSKQATESTESLAMDIHVLRQTLTESFGMLAEVRSKLAMFKEPRISKLEIVMPNLNQANQRQIAKFQNALAANDVQLKIVAQQIQGLWVNYQDTNQTQKKLRIPSLEIVYQTLSTYKDIVSRERENIKRLKKKLIEISTDMKPLDSWNDSIISMSLQEKVESESSMLTNEKLKNLRTVLNSVKIMKSKTRRPTRTSLNTEVILEDKIKKVKATKPKAEKKIVTPASKKNESISSGFAIPKPISNTQQTLIGGTSNISIEPIKLAAPKAINPANFAKPQSTSLFGHQKAENPMQAFSFSGLTDPKKKESSGLFAKSFPENLTGMKVGDAKTTPSKPISLKAAPNTPQSATPTTGVFDFSFNSLGLASQPAQATQPADKRGSILTSLAATDFTTPIKPKTETTTSIQSSLASLPSNISVFKVAGDTETSILDSLKICKPTEAPKTTSAPPFSLGSEVKASPVTMDSKPLFGQNFSDSSSSMFKPKESGTFFGSPATVPAVPATTTTAKVISTIASTQAPPVQNLLFGKPSGTASISPVASTVSAPLAVTAVNLTKPSFSFLTTSTPATVASQPSGFSSISIAPAKSETTPPITTLATTSTSAATFSFVIPSTTPPAETTTATTTAFGSNVTQLFGGFSFTQNTTAPTTTTAPPFNNVFGSEGTTSSPILKEMPKPDQSVFETVSAASTLSLQTPATIATTAASFDKPTTSAAPFGISSSPSQVVPASGTSMFGASTTNQPSGFSPPSTPISSAPFGTPSGTPASGFATPPPTSGTSLFGGQQQSLFGGAGMTTTTSTSSPFSTAFGTPATTNQNTGGTLFSASSFVNSGQTTGSVFGGTGAQASSQPQGFGTSLFGGSSAAGGNQAPLFGGSGQPAFGGGTTGFGNPPAFGSASTPAFGQTPAFGSPSASGPFMQGGPSIAQTGFGSPGSPGGFGKSGFGAAPSFGGPPTFGSPPTFGGSPVFGAPKTTFGGFASNSPPGAFSAPAQKNNLFESLGSSDTGPSFGNLAQNAFAADAAKQQFGGSSFSSWR